MVACGGSVGRFGGRIASGVVLGVFPVGCGGAAAAADAAATSITPEPE